MLEHCPGQGSSFDSRQQGGLEGSCVYCTRFPHHQLLPAGLALHCLIYQIQAEGLVPSTLLRTEFILASIRGTAGY